MFRFKRKYTKYLYIKQDVLSTFMILLILTLGITQNTYCITPLSGIIKGKVIDSDTKEPLIGTNIIVINTKLGASTDSKGDFTIDKVPVGSYTFKFSYIGYEPLFKTDVIVKSNRITFLAVSLKMTTIETEGITVSAGFFSQTDDQPTSIINFSAEEIRRGPGSAGDISRILFSLPSISKVSDNQNSLIVRGGSPAENSFYIDNIEIPNINHFPVQASSAGHIGLLNVDFINDVNFYTGGFSAAYGDKLSSVMDLSFREGNKNEVDFQLDLNVGGIGAIGEGPVANGKGSWLFSARHSFLDLIVMSLISENESTIPKYSDYQTKFVYNLSDKHKIILLNITALDKFSNKKADAIENSKNIYGGGKVFQSTTGFNCQYLWGNNGFSNLSLSHTFTKRNSKYLMTRTEDVFLDHFTLDQYYNLRNINYYRINSSHSVEGGIEAKLLNTEYDNFYAQYIDLMGNLTSELHVDEKELSTKLSTFLNYKLKAFSRLTFNTGFRVDYFNFSENTHISPRFSFSYQINEMTSLNGATGVYYQNLPMILLSQNENYKYLKDPVSYHYILGIHRLLTENTRLTIEFYHKDYDHFPLNPNQPYMFIMDQIVYDDFFLNHEELVSEGKAFSRGCEIMIQKKLVENLYGTISGTYSKTKYRDIFGIWRDRVFDNQFMVNIEGGYKPNRKWEFSLRWSYAGGIPYTPFDEKASEETHKGILNTNQINSKRLPPYHSLNIRFDRRFYFSKTNLILYLDIWNVYSRKNISRYIWNEVKNRSEPMKLWTNSTIPGFGVEFEF